MRIWLVFVVGGIGTYLMRASFFIIGSRVTLPPWFRRALPYVAPAVFAAIVAPPLFGEAELTASAAVNPRLLAAVVAGLVGWRTRNIGSVLIVGMISLWLLQRLGL